MMCAPPGRGDRRVAPAVSDDYHIVRATWRDTWAVHRLERATFPARDTYSLLEVWLLLVWPGLVNLKALTPDGRLVGFTSGGAVPGSGRTWIITLGVHPAYRRRGLGRRLLEACEARLNDHTIYLTVRASNTPAIRLYEQHGYLHVRTRPRYYPGGEDGLEMRKDRP